MCVGASGIVVLALAVFTKLDVRWVLSATLVLLSGALAAAADKVPATGYAAAMETAGHFVSVSAMLPLLVYTVRPSASWLWLLVVPTALLWQLRPLVAGLWPRTIPLRGIALRNAKNPSPGLLRLAHMSDLHFCVTPAIEGALSPPSVKQTVERALCWSLERAPFVLVTGDLTDTGSPEEWNGLMELLNSLDPDGSRIHCVPGNHDLAITLESEAEDSELLLRHENQHYHFAMSILRRSPTARAWTDSGMTTLDQVLSRAAPYIQQYEKTPPEHVRIHSRTNGFGLDQVIAGAVRMGKPLHAVEAVRHELALSRLVPPALSEAASMGGDRPFWPVPGRPLFMDLVKALYPIILREDERSVLIGLNSNTSMANSILDGAFGRLGRAQLERLATLLEGFKDRCKIIMLHHHVGATDKRRLRGLLSRTKMKTLQLRDAAELHRVLARHKNVIVCHGHQHVGYHARKGQALILSAASVAYGNRYGGPSCVLYEIDAGAQEPGVRAHVLDTATFAAN
jgi:hypothetical protein